MLKVLGAVYPADPLKRATRAFAAAGLAFAIGVAALGYVNWSEAREQQRMRSAFCGLVMPIGHSPIQPTTETGRTYKNSAVHAAGVLGCSGH